MPVELATAVGDMAHLHRNFVAQMPRQNEDAIGFDCIDRADVVDRDMLARREPAVLVGAAIDDEVEVIDADPAII